MLENLVVGTLTILIGLVIAFFGYGLWRIAITLAGFVAGYELGSALSPGNWLLPVLVGVVLALVAGVLAYFLWSLGVVVAGVLSGAALGSGALAALGLFADSKVILVGAFAGAVLGGLLAYLLKDIAVVALMAFAGAAAAAHGVVLAMPFLSGGPVSTVLSGVIIGAIGVLGFLTQYSLFRARFTDELHFERPA